MTSQSVRRSGTSQPARICVTNAKGGTGKTTIAINLAGALNARGHDILFVDLDPQGNATEGLGLPDAYDAEPPSLFDALTTPGERDVVNDLIIEHEEMDVLPSNVDLLHAEHELTIADLMARFQTTPGIDADPSILSPLAINATPDLITTDHAKNQLSLVLDAVDRDYDYIIIDSPPFFGELTDLGLYAAPNIIVPALTEAASERAIELLFDQVASLEDATDVTIQELGAVANRVEHTNEDREMLQWLNRVFADVPVWEVRKRVALQRAFSDGVSLLSYAPNSDMADVFRTMAADVEAVFTPQEANSP